MKNPVTLSEESLRSVFEKNANSSEAGRKVGFLLF